MLLPSSFSNNAFLPFSLLSPIIPTKCASYFHCFTFLFTFPLCLQMLLPSFFTSIISFLIPFIVVSILIILLSVTYCFFLEILFLEVSSNIAGLLWYCVVHCSYFSSWISLKKFKVLFEILYSTILKSKDSGIFSYFWFMLILALFPCIFCNFRAWVWLGFTW